MPSFTVEQEIDFEVFCGRCGAGLCNNSEVSKTPRRGMNAINVEPCAKCAKATEDEAYERGYEKGQEDEAKNHD